MKKYLFYIVIPVTISLSCSKEKSIINDPKAGNLGDTTDSSMVNQNGSLSEDNNKTVEVNPNNSLNVNWDISIGSSEYDSFQKVEILEDDTFILLWWQKEDDEYITHLDKVNKNGEILKSVSFGHANVYTLDGEFAKTLIYLKNGNLLVPSRNGSFGTLVLKYYDTQLNYLYSDYYANDYQPEKIIQLMDGNLLLTYSDHVTKINPDKKRIVWKKWFSSEYIDSKTKIIKSIELPNQEILVLGNSNSPNFPCCQIGATHHYTFNNGYYDYFIAKLNIEGEVLWQKLVGGDLNESASDILYQETTENITLFGTSNSRISGNKTMDRSGQSSQQTYDFWLVQMDLQGNLIKDKQIDYLEVKDPNMGFGNRDVAFRLNSVSTDGQTIIMSGEVFGSSINNYGICIELNSQLELSNYFYLLRMGCENLFFTHKINSNNYIFWGESISASTYEDFDYYYKIHFKKSSTFLGGTDIFLFSLSH